MTSIVEGHTVHRYDGELSVMHLLLVEMGGLVTHQLEQSLGCLSGTTAIEQVGAIIERDNEVDELEVKIDAEIQSLLARRTPVARDLRVVITCSKVVSDLERIGDEAIRVAELAGELFASQNSAPEEAMLRDIKKTGVMALDSLHRAIDVLDSFDQTLAQSIIDADKQLDEEFRDSVRRMITFIMEDPQNVRHAIRIVQVIKALERVGNHAKSIAEHVIYLISGEDVRHNH